MEAAQVEPNSSMYNAVISAYAQKAEVRRAEYWLEKMCEAAAGADVASYSAVIHACAKANDVKRAELWVEKMQEAGVEANMVTYNSVINACARTADADRAEAWLQRMEARGVSPGVLTFNSLINACTKANHVDRAEKWLEGMRSRNLTPDVVSYSTVIHACTQSSAPDRAEKWLERMMSETCPAASLSGHRGQKSRQPSAFCLNSVVQAFARTGNGPKAAKWMQVVLQDGVEANPASFCAVVSAFVRSGDLEEAESWLARMLAEGFPVPRSGGGSYEAVERAYMERGDRVRAAAVRKALYEAKTVSQVGRGTAGAVHTERTCSNHGSVKSTKVDRMSSRFSFSSASTGGTSPGTSPDSSPTPTKCLASTSTEIGQR